MVLIKINKDHYIIVDDSDYKEGDFVYDSKDNVIRLVKQYLKDDWCKKIIYSTEPLDRSLFFTDRVWGCERLSLGEVKELIGDVSHYTQPIEDNTNKKYTEEDMRKIFIYGKQLGLSIAGAIRNGGDIPDRDAWFIESIQSLQPKTEWEVEFIEGKLKLK